MAMSSGTLRFSATLVSPYHHHHPNRLSLPSSSSKVDSTGFISIGVNSLEAQKFPGVAISRENTRGHVKVLARNTGDYELAPSPAEQEIESFLLNAINMSFFDRLNIAWKVIFPSRASRRSSNARIAKQRLKMILFSDRCDVSDEAKRKIVNNIIHALSDFVEIESEDKVQLNVSTDGDLGTVYSVTVPVRRVKPEYQDVDEAGTITNVDYKDTRDGSVDVRFDFYVPE
ncbi:PREDICTED: cell division topological specificity factor homolog, chloroplastic [Camelina sativa]|uniref:Cell division topological specificity factor homolog, chloroplastic n=1 Tax=Camelina sativa TaxID=90675 RepID=A0ABM0WGW5_CAMSA|nr:PREDICTED: cell division topological specificity factor homolog, chloroplastic [Camelina sativa]